MAKVTLSATALMNLESIHEYISKDAEFYADKVIAKILQRITILETHPMIGKVVREFGNPLVRELIEGKYKIIYEIISEGEISVLRIYHGARLLKDLKIKPGL